MCIICETFPRHAEALDSLSGAIELTESLDFPDDANAAGREVMIARARSWLAAIGEEIFLGDDPSARTLWVWDDERGGRILTCVLEEGREEDFEA